MSAVATVPLGTMTDVAEKLATTTNSGFVVANATQTGFQ